MDINNTLEIETILAAMSPEVHARFQEAIALGRWPNGEKLTDEQKTTCMNAVIVYENHFKEPTERTGFVPPKITPCDDEGHIHTEEKPLNWT